MTNPDRDSSGEEIKVGDLISWKSGHGNPEYGCVQFDAKFYNGMRIGGRSVHNIVDESDEVKIIKPKNN